MANSEHLQLDVVTPSGSVLSAQVDSVQAPSVEGEFGVLPNHLPLLAALKCGL
ncbi:MAG: ATP synthase F1 subunit epsilon, partial [Deltaproteobacteria bacterium]|nr:ATP synthase F1 subunit epsilon [Deltaproteobacteria bacterium]